MQRNHRRIRTVAFSVQSVRQFIFLQSKWLAIDHLGRLIRAAQTRESCAGSWSAARPSVCGRSVSSRAVGRFCVRAAARVATLPRWRRCASSTRPAPAISPARQRSPWTIRSTLWIAISYGSPGTSARERSTSVRCSMEGHLEGLTSPATEKAERVRWAWTSPRTECGARAVQIAVPPSPS